MCGDYLDTLPKEALVVVLANMSFKDVYSSALISKRFASVINTYSFRKAFALKHKGEWEYIVRSWFMKNSYKKLVMWIPVLLETNAWNPTSFDNFAIKAASTHGYTEIVKLLLADPRVDPSANNNSPIKAASTHGYTEIVKLLLADPRVDPSANNNSAIRKASANGYTEIVKLLLADPRVDPSAAENYALQKASTYGRTEIVKLLLADSRVDPSANNNYALRIARRRGHTAIVNLLEDYFRRKQEREAGQEGETKRLKLGKFLF
jgi:hypothetical protein